MEFGQYLRQKREAKGMTIRQLALYAGCSDSYISMLERGMRGQHGPGLEFLRKLAKPLGIPYEVLLKEAGYSVSEVLAEPEPITVIRLLRETLGDTRQLFADRLGLQVDEVELMEQQDVSMETVEVVYERLFGSQRLLTANQKMLIDRMQEKFHTDTSEIAQVMEKVLQAFVD